MRNYEMMYIVKPDLDEEQKSEVVARIEKILTSQGGQIDNTDDKGKRRLAYEIDDFKEGYYVIVNFKSEPEAITEMERQISLTDPLIRHLIVNEDE